MPTHDDFTPLEPLTEREYEILQMLEDGLSNKQIAEKLFLTVATIRWYLRNIYPKLDVKNRNQAAKRYREMQAEQTAPKHNLRNYRSSFVGRDAQIAEIRVVVK